MFSVITKQGLGTFMLLSEQIAKTVFGVEFPEGSVSAFADSLYTVVSFVLLAWSLFTRDDAHYGIFRK